MTQPFKPNGLPVLIGSLPVTDHAEAAELVHEHTPDIPVWPQLPAHPQEGMIVQYMPGLPGLTQTGDKQFLDTAAEHFQDELLAFYEEFMAVTEGGAELDASRFILAEEIAPGIYTLMSRLKASGETLSGIKGQVTGPITFATSVKDQNGRAVFYHDELRDVTVKHLAQNARWQIQKLSEFGKPVIIFLDEPALAGFGASEFISISKDDVKNCLNEVIDAVHAEGGLAGIHVCANTEWDMILETEVDIVNFDAYSFFDRFILYPEAVKKFLSEGKMIAWGIVPTDDPEVIDRETPESLLEKWEEQARQMEALGFDRETVLSQTFITPSCGVGSLSVEHASRVLMLTRELSAKLRRQ